MRCVSQAALAFLLALALTPAAPALPAGAATGPLGQAAVTEPVEIPQTALLIDKPAAWWKGGVFGEGTVLSFIGDGDGYPRFDVMTDAEVEPVAASGEQAVGLVEELFEALVSAQPRTRILEAGWQSIGGLRVHSSVSQWPSVAGEIRARRLVLLYLGRFYVISWVERATEFDAIAQLVETCARSLRPANRAGAVGPT